MPIPSYGLAIWKCSAARRHPRCDRGGPIQLSACLHAFSFHILLTRTLPSRTNRDCSYLSLSFVNSHLPSRLFILQRGDVLSPVHPLSLLSLISPGEMAGDRFVLKMDDDDSQRSAS